MRLTHNTFAWLLTPLLVAAPATLCTADADSEAANPPTATTQPVNGPSILVKSRDRVDIHVVDVPLATVLRMLSTQSGRNIITSPKVKGNVTADLFDVTFADALNCILWANGCAFQQRGNFLYVCTLEELAEQQAAAAPDTLVARLFYLHYITVDDVKPMIEPLLSEDGKIAVTSSAESGLETSGTEAGGNALSSPDAVLVYDHLSRVEQIAKVVRELDVRPRQVLIEATILRAQLGEDNALGIDFNIVDGVNFELLGGTSLGLTDLETGQVAAADLNKTNMTIRTDLAGVVPQGGFTFGIIKDRIAVFLRALEQVTDVTVLANPKVLTLNKQRGEVIVGRRDGYLTTTVTETTAVQTVDFLETGTQLVFRPFIGDDGYVRMEIHPEDSSGGLNEANLPFERTTEVTANIMVRDGHTVLIGGLFRESTNATRGQVPVLGNLPLAGALFRTTIDSTSREEVIILLTVHIVKDDQAYHELSEDLAEEVERIRLGSRRGVQAFGRDRLGMTHYCWALEHLEAGQYDKALWDVQLALHISPLSVPAMKLREKLVGRELCERQVGAIRDLIARRIMGEDPEPTVPPLPDRTDTQPPATTQEAQE
ncbi:MAG TPA: hypothetical protein VMZ31_02045 [Phycisphaerae bacterium]|nr:hypothetical protein [Phycisphaerae bacterium]